MANGWGPDGGVQDQIDATVTDAVSAARSRLPSGAGTIECEVCGEEIPLKRRQAIPGVRTCIACQSERDKRPTFFGINRRGNKDSQLR
jgi:phage/conjugal plasmid C-4 type zinc finger TraR family protein